MSFYPLNCDSRSCQNSTAKEGHNSTKTQLNNDPGSVFNEEVKILSYTVSLYCDQSADITSLDVNSVPQKNAFVSRCEKQN